MNRRIIATLLALATAITCSLTTALAATEIMHPLTSTDGGNGNYYINKIGDTGIVFVSNIKLGGNLAEPVKITLGNTCKLYVNGTQRTGGELSKDGISSSYWIRETGNYLVKVLGPMQNDQVPYSTASFKLLSSPSTVYVPTEIFPLDYDVANQQRTITQKTGSAYSLNFESGAVLTKPAVIDLSGYNMSATVSIDGGAAQTYISGTELTKPGRYTMVINSSNALNNSKDSSTVNFTVDTIQETKLAGLDYRYDTGYLKGSEVDLNLGTAKVETLIKEVGTWTPPSSKSPDAVDQLPSDEYPPLILAPSDNWDISDFDKLNVETGGPQSSYISSDGHTVAMTPINERYHSEFATYEQEFAGKYFYTSVSNGSITASPVVIDVPAGITVTMEKDGFSAAFPNKTKISDYASYSLRLSTYSEDGGEYVGQFRFRIQPLPAGSTGGTAGTAGTAGSTGGTPTGIPGLTFPEGTEIPDMGAITPPDVALTPGDISSMIDEVTKPDPAEQGSKTGSPTGLLESFDVNRKLFLQNDGSALNFYSSVPNGAVVSTPINLTFDKEPESIVVTRNDEPLEYITGSPFTEPGIYCVQLNAASTTTALNGGVIPTFTFRILSGASNTPNIIYPPTGYSIATVTLDDEVVKTSGRYLQLGEDGYYAITMSSSIEGAPTLSLDMNKDTTPAEFRVLGVENGASTGAEVSIEYLSEDMSHVELLHDGKPADKFDGRTITKPGSYTLNVYDNAGNCSTASFTMTYRMNTTAVLAIILLILLTAVGVVFVLRTRKQISVR